MRVCDITEFWTFDSTHCSLIESWSSLSSPSTSTGSPGFLVLSATTIMPSPAFHTHTDAPTTSSQQLNGRIHAHPTNATTHSWRSVFRMPNSSSKKLAASASLPLSVDTVSLASSSNGRGYTPITPTPSLTPASLLSDQRSSYNSSSTQSSDSNGGGAPSRSSTHPASPTAYRTQTDPSPFTSRTLHPDSHYASSSSATTTIAPAPSSRSRTKSEKQRTALARNPTAPRAKAQTANPSQASFVLPPIPHRTPLSPRAMGASASRFIRRVASAPNAKGLFSLSSRASSGAPTRNGLLAPGDVRPPPLPGSLEKGADSLETISSGSSREQGSRSRRATGNYATAPPLSPSSKPWMSSGMLEGPGKIAFRRTYSSNSIKVRQVGILSCF